MSQRGFTLIEAMVILTIVAMLLVFGLPSAGDFIRNQRVRTVAESLQIGLQKARDEAVRRNTSVTLWLVAVPDSKTLGTDCTLSASTASWIVSLDSPEGACGAAVSTTAAPRLVAGHPAGDAGAVVSISAVQADGTTAANRVTYNGFGQVANSDAISKITITSAASPSNFRRLRIDISGGGQLRVCDFDVTNAADPRHCS